MAIGQNIDISLVSSINRKINSSMELSDLLNSIMDTARDLIGTEGASILLSDKKTGDLIFYVATGKIDDILIGKVVPGGKGIVGNVAETGCHMIVNDVQNNAHFFKEIDKKTEFTTRNILCVPMKVMDEFVGVLELVNKNNNENFDEFDLEKCDYIAYQSAVAISNRKLYDDLTSRVNELTSLYKVSQAVTSSTNYDEILEKMIISLCTSMKVKKGSIIIMDGPTSSLKIEAGFGLPGAVSNGYVIDRKGSIAGQVYKTGDPMIVSDVQTEVDASFFINKNNYSTDSFISVPIQYKNESIGVVNLSDKENGRVFDSYDLRVLTTVAMQIAEVYQNCQNEKNRESQKKLEHELEIASEMQKSGLRNIPSSFKDQKIFSYNKPAKAVGGDFYDFVNIDENRYGLFIADVSGKGIPAAIYMGAARNILRAESRVNLFPARTLSESNFLLLEESESSMFVTVFYIVIDTKKKKLKYCSGGHCNQFLIKKETRDVVKLNTVGKPLGLFDNFNYEEKSEFYEEGDLLLLFTDGVAESFSLDEKDVEEGERILADIALKHIEENPTKLVNNLKNRLKEQLDSDYRDDFTFIVIKL